MGMRFFQFIAAVFAVFFIFAVIGCGPKAIKKESVLDTPENHFNQGMRELDRGNLMEAKREFDRAKALDPKYAEAYAGMGLALATEAEGIKEAKAQDAMYEKALAAVDEATGKNDKSVESYIIKGRILAMRMKGEDWINDAVKQYDKALKLNPNSDKAYFYMGEAYKNAYQFDMAANAYSKAIAMKGEYAGKANDQWAIVQKIQRAAPGTKIGAKIALIPEIDRADLAVLLLEELKLAEVFAKKKQPTFDTEFKAPEDPTKMAQPQAEKLPEATDISNHWAKNWIVDIIKLGGMEPFPDHTFRPDELITRANYAMTMQQILIMATGDQTLATKYFGGQSRFPDMRSDHFAYNAAALMADRGIMTADKITGAFNPEGHISGADALLVIRDFQNALRMEFR
ncbi:MAG: tetratricopeptide repeat protein [candidate division KSB1 bacterium]|nr:tetratricopeptide repeat protein [candidate division KSB1 bacterium]MDZ7300547.1 tetratricopeptide repeat protein [candidate division KSB1 bacterium]MDZ7309686.1 tetratricopeptide repeat protein [candidate division KSB1 bacterium]